MLNLCGNKSEYVWSDVNFKIKNIIEIFEVSNDGDL